MDNQNLKTIQIDILFSTKDNDLYIDIEDVNDKEKKENLLLSYLIEHGTGDITQLAVIDVMDPVLSCIARSINDKLIEYNFYEFEAETIKINSVKILTPYTVLVRFLRLT
jgi:hypothetical protein